MNIDYFLSANSIICLIVLLFSTAISKFKKKNKKLTILAVFLYSCFISYYHLNFDSYLPFIFIVLSFVLFLFIQSLPIAYLSFLPIHLPIIIFYVIPLLSIKFDFLNQNQPAYMLIIYGYTLIILNYFFISSSNYSKFDPLAFKNGVALLFVCLSIQTLAIEFMLPRANLPVIELNISNAILVFFIFREVFSKIIIQNIIAKMLFSKLPIVRVAIAAISYLSYSMLISFGFINIIFYLIGGLISALFYEYFGLSLAVLLGLFINILSFYLLNIII